MTADTSPATTAERDARIINTRHEDVNPNDIAIGVIIGRTSEFFDFFVYAIASVLVFPKLIFSFANEGDAVSVAAMAWSFAVFALAFVARPLGTLIFMAIDRAYGRGLKLTIALFGLGTSTVMIAFVPSFAEVGWIAPIALAILRFGQGLSLGGAWDGLASLLAMNAPKQHRGWYAMIPQLGAPLGLIVASLLFAFFIGFLSADDFYAWGWRYPFFCAFAINVVALFARLRIVVTPEYTRLFESQELQPAPVMETLRRDWNNVLIGAFLPLASFALFHMVTVFPLTWTFLHSGASPAQFLIIEASAAAVGVLSILASGLIADQFGRRRLLGISAIGIAIFSLVAPLLLQAEQVGEFIYMSVGFMLLGLSFGQSSGAAASNFSKKYRYTGSAITSDHAWMLGAGFAPLVALLLAEGFGLFASGLYLLSGALCTIAALAINRRLEFKDN